MKRTLVAEAKKKIGEKVLLYGWVQTVRDQGNIKFILLRDRTGVVQVVVTKSAEEGFKKTATLTLESVISVSGKVKEEKQAPGGYEVLLDDLEILSEAQPELPIPVVEKSQGETNIAKRLDWRWLDLRKEPNRQIFEVWTALEEGFRKYWRGNGYIQIYSPSLMNTASESGAQVFELSYFDKKAYLAQSPQFYKQLAMAAGFEKVFMVGPVFRAEPSFTTRHMTEFTGWDFEISFIDSHLDIMEQEEGMIVSGFEQVAKDTEIDVEIPKIPFPKLSLADAKKKLEGMGIKSDKSYDLSPEEEKGLGDIAKKEYGHDFIFLTDYPVKARPFYHMRHSDDSSLTKSFDLLYRGLEITTGAQREHRIEILEKQAREKKMNLASLSNYFNFFRFGCPPHGGGGIGPGRIVMKLINLKSVKEATFLPRDVRRLSP